MRHLLLTIVFNSHDVVLLLCCCLITECLGPDLPGEWLAVQSVATMRERKLSQHALCQARLTEQHASLKLRLYLDLYLGYAIDLLGCVLSLNTACCVCMQGVGMMLVRKCNRCRLGTADFSQRAQQHSVAAIPATPSALAAPASGLG